MIAVTDTGTGMTDKVKSHIFEPFFTTKEPGRGTGLGLATCYGIIQQSGGHIAVESAPASDNQLTGQTVLVAEDEDVVRELTSLVLRQAGFHVLASDNGKHALELAVNYAGTIDLLLTDAVMPEMGGQELARRLRQQRNNVRVLLASGHTEDSLRTGPTGESEMMFLQKPFSPVALVAKVRAALS